MVLSQKSKDRIGIFLGDLLSLLNGEGVDRRELIEEMRASDHIHFGETHYSDTDHELAIELARDAGPISRWFVEKGGVRLAFQNSRDFNNLVAEHGSQVHYEEEPAKRVPEPERQEALVNKLAELSAQKGRVVTHFGESHTFPRDAKDRRTIVGQKGYPVSLLEKSSQLGLKTIGIKLFDNKPTGGFHPLTTRALSEAVTWTLEFTPKEEKAEVFDHVEKRIEEGLDKLEGYLRRNKTDVKIVKLRKNEFAYLRANDFGATRQEIREGFKQHRERLKLHARA